jgi:hypothetical protein
VATSLSGLDAVVGVLAAVVGVGAVFMVPWLRWMCLVGAML